MESRKPLHDEEYEDGGEYESDATTSSSSTNEDSSSDLESEDEAKVNYLMLEEKGAKKILHVSKSGLLDVIDLELDAILLLDFLCVGSVYAK